MQDFNPLRPTELISSSRSTINNNMESVASHFSGTYFPTANLVAGMYCWRTDLNKMYQLNADLVNWTLVNDMSQGYNSVAHANRADYATKDANGNDIATTYSKQEETSQIILQCYPIGSIYMSVNSTDPSTLFGGTWQQLAGGRVLMGQDSSHQAGTTGGSETESYTPSGTIGSTALTVNQIPAHSHSAWTDTQGNHTHTYYTPERPAYNNDEGKYGGETWNIDASGTYTTSAAGAHAHNVGIGNTGGSQGHTHSITGEAKTISHLQPYLSVYMWKRVS